ncbi:MAG: hypothetical protein J6S63_09205 [Atopobiaceae bacterium]|nr:hypothetical protein [Atopobiaceae bacterium]
MGKPVYVFCHGLNGHGQYDAEYEKNPYWGGASGDVVAEWRSRGLDAYAASVAPQGSAWDRACELYAQISGTRTDYGKAHSEAYHHGRMGKDFTGRQLIPSWDDDTRLVLIGHSFGGATIRLLSELLAYGSEEERAATAPEDLSPLFCGGMQDRVRAIVTLAAPTNGTTAYDLADDPAFDERSVKVRLKYKLLNRLVRARTKIKTDGRDPRDWANWDMRLDNAQALSKRIHTLPHVYYLSVACDATNPADGGRHVPDTTVMDPLFVRTGANMGAYCGTSAAGCVVDDAWHANDGLVNTISARAPFEAPSKPLDPKNVERGIWNVMEDLRADHTFFSGGYLHKTDPHPFFDGLLELLQALE